MRKTTARGFTLVELLIVIAIIAVLAAVVVLIVNPIEMTKRSRDAARLTDLANLQQAISVAIQEATQSGQNLLCNGGAYGCRGDSVAGGNQTGNGGAIGARKSDGTGWVAVKLSGTNMSIPVLPIDPINSNTGTGNGNHYVYCADSTAASGESWEIVTKLESTQQQGKMANDGGSPTGTYNGQGAQFYEQGTNLSLLGSTLSGSGGTCSY